MYCELRTEVQIKMIFMFVADDEKSEGLITPQLLSTQYPQAVKKGSHGEKEDNEK